MFTGYGSWPGFVQTVWDCTIHIGIRAPARAEGYRCDRHLHAAQFAFRDDKPGACQGIPCHLRKAVVRLVSRTRRRDGNAREEQSSRYADFPVSLRQGRAEIETPD